MNLEFIKPQNLVSLLMKSSQSNSNLRSLGSYLVRSYLITTVNGEPNKLGQTKTKLCSCLKVLQIQNFRNLQIIML